MSDGPTAAKPCNILFLAERMWIGGAERHFIGKAVAMRERGCRVVMASAGGPLEDELRRLGLRHVALREDAWKPASITPGHLMEDIHDLVAACREEGLQVVNCMPSVPFMLGGLLRETLELPLAFETLTPFPCVPEELAPLLRRVAEEGGFFAAGVHDAQQQARAAGIDPAAARIVPLAVDVEQYRPMDRAALRAGLGIDRRALVVFVATRLEARKAEYVGALIDALAGFLPRHPELLLLVAGDGGLRPSLEAHAARRGLPARFLGFVDGIHVGYGAADICVGNGTAALEAAACGRPVVLTAFPPNQFASVGYWGDDAYGSLGSPYPGAVWHALADLLAPLVEDPGMRERMGAASREGVVRRHATGPVMDRWFEIFGGLAARRPQVEALATA